MFSDNATIKANKQQNNRIIIKIEIIIIVLYKGI